MDIDSELLSLVVPNSEDDEAMETMVPEMVVPDSLAPETLVPDSVAPEAVAAKLLQQDSNSRTVGRTLTPHLALAIVVPFVVYWAYSGMYVVLGQSMDKYRLHSRAEEDSKNLVSKRDVVKVVLSQQLLQAVFSGIVLAVTGDSSASSSEVISTKQSSSFLTLARQFAVAMIVLDGWQYMCHRYFHQNRFLYRHIHSWHHRLLVPYPYGTFYSHPAEGFLLDTIGSLLAFVASGMSPRASIFFFSFGTMKAIDDHCGLMLPWNLFHRFFWNNTAYHDLHHQLRGGAYNFSQPFFVTWDKVFGTHMPYVLEERPEGGLQVRPLMDKASSGKQI